MLGGQDAGVTEASVSPSSPLIVVSSASLCQPSIQANCLVLTYGVNPVISWPSWVSFSVMVHLPIHGLLQYPVVCSVQYVHLASQSFFLTRRLFFIIIIFPLLLRLGVFIVLFPSL